MLAINVYAMEDEAIQELSFTSMNFHALNGQELNELVAPFRDIAESMRLAYGIESVFPDANCEEWGKLAIIGILESYTVAEYESSLREFIEFLLFIRQADHGRTRISPEYSSNRLIQELMSGMYYFIDKNGNIVSSMEEFSDNLDFMPESDESINELAYAFEEIDPFTISRIRRIRQVSPRQRNIIYLVLNIDILEANTGAGWGYVQYPQQPWAIYNWNIGHLAGHEVRNVRVMTVHPRREQLGRISNTAYRFGVTFDWLVSGQLFPEFAYFRFELPHPRSTG